MPAATFTVTTTNDSGPGSLREAILAANGSGGADFVHFNIPGPGLHTITLSSTLPTITDAIIIDGHTQPGAVPNTSSTGLNAVLQIEINGAGVAVHGFHLFSHAGSAIRGLVINRASNNGIYVDRGGGHTIAGNYIGTNAAGTAALPNGENGVLLEGTFNLVGGTAPASRNLISGNSINGVMLRVNGAVDVGPCSSANGNTIQGNLIGTNAAGTGALPNAAVGVTLVHTCTLFGTPDAGPFLTDTLIGGTPAGARNVISGNGGIGVAVGNGELRIQSNRIQGNYIGLNAAGTAALPNDTFGIEVKSPLTTIGGTAAGAANVISGNAGSGIHLREATGSVVQGNHIGTNAAGTAAVPNTANGIVISATTTTLTNDTGNTVTSPFSARIGGTAAGEGNLIAGNLGIGVLVESSDTTQIQGNFIGTSSSATPIPNGSDGINIGGGSGDQANIVGGTALGAGNVIVANGGNGVSINGTSGNAVRGNSIDANGGLGIELAPGGPTPNDPLDADAGSNDLQNHPVLTATAVNGASITIHGSLSSTPNTSFDLDFYSSLSCDPSGFGEGSTYFGTQTFSTDASGNLEFEVTFVSGTPIGSVITATATPTSAPLNTSEFSQCIVAAVGVPATLQFSSATYSVNENGGSVLITVTRTSNPTGTVTVDASTSDGTATAGSDFTDTDVTLTFEDGQTTATFSIPITNDALFEDDETILLTLSNPTGGTILGATSSSTVTIVDDEALAQAESIPALDPRLLAALAIALAAAAVVAMRN